MILIGITGGSGSGKSTVTKLLKERLPDCIAINLDEYMRKYCNEHKRQIISELNLTIENDDWSTHLVNSYDDIKKWVSIIETDIEKCVRKIILDNKDSVSIIVLDWAFLSLLQIYSECEFSIMVTCDFDIKLDRLTKRLEVNKKLEKWNNALSQRLKNTALDEFGHFATYLVSNNGSLNDLIQSVECILDDNKAILFN